jgi:hypothetical protein
MRLLNLADIDGNGAKQVNPVPEAYYSRISVSQEIFLDSGFGRRIGGRTLSKTAVVAALRPTLFT